MKYNSSRELTRHFCSTCGANIYIIGQQGDLDICSGALDWSGQKGLLELVDHIFLSSTKDGGGSPWFPDPKAWSGFSKTSDGIDISAAYPPPSTQPKRTSDSLTCYCQCRSIRFELAPPSAESSATVSGPSAEYLVPYVPASPLFSPDFPFIPR
ncbi:MAG: hypothetical protein Q9164_002781, partial [Protoblastenia rupestris]